MRAILICLVLIFAGASTSSASEPIRYGEGRQVATLADSGIHESSGIAASRTTPDAFWTHNDAGGEPRLFAFGRDGRDLGRFQVGGACRDWEDIASAVVRGRPYLVVGDIGDNDAKRDGYAIHVIDEPRLGPTPAAKGHLKATSYAFRYQDGAHNCEALAVDPATGVVHLVTKVKGGGGCAVYQLITPLADPSARPPFVAVKVADLAIPTVTAMDISPDGRRAIVLTYANALEYTRAPDATWAAAFAGQPRTLTVPRGKQSEAICYGADGATIFLTSETGKKLPAPPCPLFELPVAAR